ncbi:MAG: ABC transporter permease, partial [Deltaproteobacteria bacterium]|nr:ABC transporter permease [Deltaproteobacteria bacterium]
MNWLSILRIAGRALQRNRLRSLLTMLGIIIGVGAVIAMVAIGQGANAAVQARIASMGTNVLAIWPGSTTSGGVRVGHGSIQTLSLADAWAIQREVPTVAAVAPSRRGTAQVIYGNQNWATVVLGTYPEYQIVRDWPVQAGQFFTQQEVGGAAKVVVLGQTVADNLFGGEDPIGKIVRIKNIPFKVVGVLAPKGQSGWGQDQDDTVLIPFTTAERQVLGTQFLGTVGSIMVTAVSNEAVREAQEQITALLRQRHRLVPDQENDFLVRNFADVAATAEETAGV